MRNDGSAWSRLALGARRLAARLRGGASDRVRLQVTGVWEIACGPLGADGSIQPHTVRRHQKNLVVNAGLEDVKDLLLNPATALVGFGWIAIGSDATPEAAGQTALGAELARGAVTYTSGGTGVATIERTFAAGVGTGAITEAGAFNDAAAGTMLNRKTFAAVNKGAGDTLKASCVVTIAPA